MQLSFCALRPASALSTQYPATISSLSCKVTECGTDQFAFTLDGCLTWEDNNEELVNCEVTPGSTLPCPYPEWNRCRSQPLLQTVSSVLRQLPPLFFYRQGFACV